jgi:hypothetical protein
VACAVARLGPRCHGRGISATSPASSLPRGRRYSIRALLTIGTILAVFSIFALFANRQVLNADNWANTSSNLLENQAIRTELSTFLIDQVYANVNVKAQVTKALPPRLDPLAGEAAAGLRTLGEKATNEILTRPRVQAAWENANRVAAQQFINIAEGNSGAVTSQGNAVYLDVRVILTELAQRLGLSGTLVSKIPPGAGRIKVMSGNQITTIQNAASTLRGLAAILPPLAFACFGLAVYLGRGRRRRLLMIAGIDLIAAGLLVLIARRIAGTYVVNSLVTTAAVKPAASAAYSIGTQLLRDIAQACVVIGLPVVFAAWLAGPTRPAVAFRRSTAPWMRERPGVVYGVVAAIVLIILAWGPIPATREIIPILVMIALVALGTELLRRQVVEEFPGATLADRPPMQFHLRRGSDGGGRFATASPAPAPPPAEAGAAAETSHVAQLERLSALHDSGALTDDEFAAEKAALRKVPS